MASLDPGAGITAVTNCRSFHLHWQIATLEEAAFPGPEPAFITASAARSMCSCRVTFIMLHMCRGVDKGQFGKKCLTKMLPRVYKLDETERQTTKPKLDNLKVNT